MEFLISLVTKAFWLTLHSLAANWPFLMLSALVAAYLKVNLDAKKAAAFLKRHKGAGVAGATAVAVTTPLCSCGTTALVLGMMASLMPWAPIVAFMVASPLTSPEELFYSAGLFGWPFAITFFVASILLGLLGGLVAHLAERQGWLEGQARFLPMAGGEPDASATAAAAARAGATTSSRWRPMAKEAYLTGRKLLFFFLTFAFLGYLLNGLIPQQWVTSLFGSGRIFGVPLAATLGVPFYINTEASLPLVRSFLDLGMSPGATLAFLITGAGTSVGAIAGALTIARWRVVGIVVGTLWVGAIVIGFAYNGLIALGAF